MKSKNKVAAAPRFSTQSMSNQPQKRASTFLATKDLKSLKGSTPTNQSALGKQVMLPTVRDSQESRVQDYYNSFMKDHFLFDSNTKKPSNGMRKRLMKIAASQSTRVSPTRQSDLMIAGTPSYNKRDSMKLNAFIDAQIQNQKPQTFFMIEQQDYRHQRKLGALDLSKRENLMDNSQFLLDQSSVLTHTQNAQASRMQEIPKEDVVEESTKQFSQLKTLLNSVIGEHSKGPKFLEDRRTELKNPMKGEEITFTELRCIDKMKAMKRYDEKKGLQRVDSLVESVYNSEKNAQWNRDEAHSDNLCPHPTEQSDDDFHIFSTESENDFDLMAEVKPYEPLKQRAISREPSIQYGDDQSTSKYAEFLQTDKHQRPMSRGRSHFNIPPGMSSYGMEQVEIAGMQIPALKEYGPYGVILRGKEQMTRFNKQIKPKHIAEIFRFYCSELQIAPVKFLHYIDNNILKLINYSVQPNLCIAISCIIPYLTQLEGIKFRNNGIKDEGAALLLRACSLCPKFRQFHFEKNEVNVEFVEVLNMVLQEQPEQADLNNSVRCMQELNLGSSRNFSKVVSKVCEVIKDSFFITLLDLSNNNLDAISCKFIGFLLRTSQNLQNLNLSYCGIRGHSARIILNSLLQNQSLKYLNLCWNAFVSSDYEFGSKIARIIQVHTSLMHLDLTSTQLKREETMYIAQCLKDSSQIISCHLSGNHVDYYSRIYLRAHLNAIVQFPFRNNTVIQNVISSFDRTQIIGLNQLVQGNLPNKMNHTNEQETSNVYDPRRYKKQFEYSSDNTGFNSPTPYSMQDSADSLDMREGFDINIDQMDQSKLLDHYLKEDKARIYDMLHMFDFYGFQKKGKVLKQEYTDKYPQGQLNVEGNVKDIQIGSFGQRGKDQIDPIEEFSTTSRRRRQSDDTNFQKALNIIFSAYDDKMVTNPMQGFLKDLIFSRYLGHEDIENGANWRDCNQCWVCEKWNKVKLNFHFDDSIQDNEFQKILDISQIQRQGEEERRELNPIWEENLDSMEDESSHQSRKKEMQYMFQSGSRPIMESSFTQSMIKHNNNKEQMTPYISRLEQTMRSTVNEDAYDQTLVQLRKEGPIDVQIKDLEGKILFNSHISSVKMNVEKLQRQIVPTSALSQHTDSQVILGNDCVPYRPFTRIQSNSKEVHIIKLPDIYQPVSPNDSKFMSSTAVNSRRPSMSSKNRTPLSISIERANKQAVAPVPFDKSPYDKYENIVPRVRTKNEILKLNDDIFKGWKNLPENEEVYLVASFNYWYPIKMDQTTKKKALIKDPKQIQDHLYKLRQHQEDLQLPENIMKKHRKNKSRQQKSFDKQEFYATIDPEEEYKYEGQKVKVESQYGYMNFLPSGKHYFYFIKQGKLYCLSDRYAIRKFKGTNLYMNEVTIAEREWKITDLVLKEQDGSEKGERFDKMRSVFRTFKDENDETLKKMFEMDFGYTKINRIIKNNDNELQKVKTILWEYYSRIKNIYLTCILTSEYPIISWNDFTIICNKCKIVDKNCNLSTIDRVYIATNVNLNHGGNQSNADRDLVRYEFLEILVRLSVVKFKDTGICSTFSASLIKLLQENIFPIIEEQNPLIFRDKQLYRNAVNDLLSRNDTGLKKLFNIYIHGQKRFLNPKDAIDLINQKAELRFLDRQVVKQFGLSKMSHIDALKDPGFPNKLSYVEFLEFLGRIAFEVFKDHETMQNEPLHLKYDALLTKLLKIVKYPKTYTMLEPHRQNVIYEIVLNPQLATTGGLEKSPSLEKLIIEDKFSEYSLLSSAKIN